MALEVYWASGSPFSWRVLLTLEVKQLSYQSKLLTFSRREHKSPEYLALNPRGKVPTLKEGDFLLYESLAIMAYLDSKYPERPLFGRTPREVGTIARLISENISYVCDPIGKIVGPLFSGSVC
jgi:glutathione S-transferase